MRGFGNLLEDMTKKTALPIIEKYPTNDFRRWDFGNLLEMLMSPYSLYLLSFSSSSMAWVGGGGMGEATCVAECSSTE